MSANVNIVLKSLGVIVLFLLFRCSNKDLGGRAHLWCQKRQVFRTSCNSWSHSHLVAESPVRGVPTMLTSCVNAPLVNGRGSALFTSGLAAEPKSHPAALQFSEMTYLVEWCRPTWVGGLDLFMPWLHMRGYVFNARIPGSGTRLEILLDPCPGELLERCCEHWSIRSMPDIWRLFSFFYNLPQRRSNVPFALLY